MKNRYELLYLQSQVRTCLGGVHKIPDASTDDTIDDENNNNNRIRHYTRQ